MGDTPAPRRRGLMTAKHFRAIAATVRQQRDPWVVQLTEPEPDARDDARFALNVIDDLAVALAGTLAGFNPEFDRPRFLHDAGANPGDT
jgi:hypothetical protein